MISASLSPGSGIMRVLSAVFSVVSGVFVILIVHAVAGQAGRAQSKSPVLKDPAAQKGPFYLKIDRSTEVLFDAFMLVKKANTGDPVAQHELGLRYLQGEDFPPDTAKAALWMARAAEQDYQPALYNQGILKNNGWGTEWDPFGAYRNFLRTARQGMPEGMYMVGLFLTDNLVVRRNYPEAYRWIKAAADSGNRYAAEVLIDFEKTGIMAQIRNRRGDPAKRDSVRHPAMQARVPQSPWQPVFLDLETDTLADPDDSTIAREALRSGDDDPAPDAGTLPDLSDTAGTATVIRAAGVGSPEALTFLGRRYERGAGVSRDRVEASVFYLRAIRNESRWSPVLLWRLSTDPALYEDLTLRIGRGDPKAAYVWASLVARGFDRRLTEKQALELLLRAASDGMTDALLELAMWHYAGYVVPADARMADSLMRSAAELGSREARLRLMMTALRAGADYPIGSGLVDTLSAMQREGSVLAQVMLGYCSKGGRGVPADIPRAVAFYRKAAQRGSRIAFEALRILYDGRRPPDPEFSVEEAGE